MSVYVQTNQAVLIPDAAVYAVSASDTGKIHYVHSQGQAGVINLPALAAGLHFRFIKTGIAANAMVITPAAGGTPMQGLLQLTTGVAGTTLAAITAGATVTFTGTSAIGDMVDMFSDGTNWYVIASSKVAAGLSVP